MKDPRYLILLLCLFWGEYLQAQTKLFKVVATSKTQQQKALKSTKNLTWVNGDTLHFVYKGPGKAINLSTIKNIPLQKLDDKTWVGSIYIPGLQKARIIGSFLETKPSFKFLNTKLYWVGRQASPMPVKVRKLKGQIKNYTVYSEALKAKHKIEVYLPPHHNSSQKNYPVAFIMDGLQNQGHYIERLILKKQIPPIILIGVLPGSSEVTKKIGYDARSIEYLEGIGGFVKGVLKDTLHFDKFVNFYTNELMQWAEQELGITKKPALRMMAGSSNGASFTAYIARKYSHLFNHYALLSFGWLPTQQKWLQSNQSYKFNAYLVAGRYEPDFYKQTKKMEEIFTSKKGVHLWKEYTNANHHKQMWERMLVKIIKQGFD